MSFKLGDARFNVAQLNHPDNPTGTVYSANRKYGRFGAFPRAAIEPGKPLVLAYRLLIRQSEDPFTREEVQRLYEDFAHPPTVTIRK
jgi:hypothetical protein